MEIKHQFVKLTEAAIAPVYTKDTIGRVNQRRLILREL